MQSVQNILCPSDVEPPAYSSLRYAFFVAERFHASLDVVHARPTAAETSPVPSAMAGQVATLPQPSVHKRLNAAIRTVRTAVSGRAAAHVVDGGPLSGILECARHFRTDLIVTSSRLTTQPNWLFLASLAEKVAYAASCAVLTVQGGASQPSLRIRRILLPVDFSKATRLAVDWAAAFARAFGATIEVLHVKRGSPPSPLALDGSGQVQALDDRLRKAGVALSGISVASGGVLECIVERMQTDGCDLVVMGTDTRQKNVDVIGAGVVASVRRQASIPVLSVRPPSSEHAFVDRGLVSESIDALQPGWGAFARGPSRAHVLSTSRCFVDRQMEGTA